MTIQKISFSALVLVFACLFLAACGNTGTAENVATEAAEAIEKIKPAAKGHDISPEERASPAYASAYICPMHCKGSGSAEAGKCPVCGMDYVANEKASGGSDGHEGHGHEGHNHGSHEGHDHGSHEGHNH